MYAGSAENYEGALSALKRIQEFDVSRLPRTEDLGSQLNFKEAVPHAQQLIDLFKRLSIQALTDFPDNLLEQIKSQANSIYNLFDQILKFSFDESNPQATRQNIIEQLKNSYQPVFNNLHPNIAYSLHRSADFQRLDAEARATLQSVEDKAEKISEKILSHEIDANRILDNIRNVAAEVGVTQQAAHFRAESEAHEMKAGEWQKRTMKTAYLLGAFATLSMFLHKIPFLKPVDMYDSIQLATSKILIFGVITYMLVLSARNFLSHQHNAVVNKHRQNALMTHRALIEGTSDLGARDAVMVHAASCIFSPQPTGYTQSGASNDSGSPRSVVEILSKPVIDTVTNAARS